MAKSAHQTTLTIIIDADLAAEYKIIHDRTFGIASRKQRSLEEFMRGCVEDHLTAEIAFIEEEAKSGRE